MFNPFSRLWQLLKPPKSWRLPVLILLGVLVGLGIATLHISNATSYLSDRPEACINCHVMIPQYATWQHSSHRRVAVCNDCHVPQDNVFRKYAFKASDGLRHSTLFTLRLEPQVIRVKEAGIRVIQENCIRCHTQLVERVSAVEVRDAHSPTGMLCWECHRETPHGRVRSLSSTPYARVPRLEPVMPEWLADFLLKKETE